MVSRDFAKTWKEFTYYIAEMMMDDNLYMDASSSHSVFPFPFSFFHASDADTLGR